MTKRSPTKPTPRPTGPRVCYRAVRPLSDKAVKALSPADLKVYREVPKGKPGVTRARLLRTLRATAHTGRVDGAIRRLRLKKLVIVVACPGVN